MIKGNILYQGTAKEEQKRVKCNVGGHMQCGEMENHLTSDSELPFNRLSICIRLELRLFSASSASFVTFKSFSIVFLKNLITTFLSAIEASSLIVACKLCKDFLVITLKNQIADISCLLNLCENNFPKILRFLN